MNLSLTVVIPLVGGETKEYDYVFDQEVVTLGRDEESDVQIPIPQVSPHHAKILLEDDHCCLVDLGSEAGTLVSGNRAESGLRTPLLNGARIDLAGCRIRVSHGEAEVPEESHEQTQQVAFRMVREVMGSMGGAGRSSPYVEVINDEERGLKVKLDQEGIEFLLGRDSDCRVILTHWSVSRHHARIVRTGLGATIEDLGSKNGVMVNEDVVKEPRTLVDGDIIFVGHTQIRFHDPSSSVLGHPADEPSALQIDLGTSAFSLEEARRTEDWDESPSGTAAKTEAPGTPAEQPYPSMRQEGQQSPHVTTPAHSDGSSKAWIYVIIIVLLLLGAAAAAYFVLEP